MKKANLLLTVLLLLVLAGCKQNANNKAENVSNGKFSNDEICTPSEGDMSGGESCAYFGKTIKQAYQIILNKYKEESKHLKKALPESSVEYHSSIDDEDVQIIYDYKGKNKLLIELNYNGGVTEIELHEENGNTLSKITYNAD